MFAETHSFAVIAVGLAIAAAISTCLADEGVGSFRGFPPAEPTFVFANKKPFIALDRGQPVSGALHLPKPVSPKGLVVTARVTDSFGRVLWDERLAGPTGDKPVDSIGVSVQVPAVIAQRHFLALTVRAADSTTYTTRNEFLYRLPKQWDDYLPTIWMRHNPKRIGYLREMYLAGSHWFNAQPGVPDHYIDQNYRYYVEGGSKSIYSPYHLFINEQVGWYFNRARDAFRKDRTNLRNLERNPCLNNPIIHREIGRIYSEPARQHRDYRPLFYTVADEPGIANQAAAFDFCHSPHCRKAFVAWLKKRYGTLEAVNAQWGTSYAKWDLVRGGLTDEAFAAADDNFSAWCDHKEFMDDVLCEAYVRAKKAMRKHDPDGRFGMGGGQGPIAVGGWDWWKICQIFEVHEAYYIGNNYELIRSFQPDAICYHASFGDDDAERHLIWYLFIHGDRGLLIWDDGSKYVDDQGNYSKRAKDFTGLYKELSDGIGKLRIASKRTDDPIALYHSQANLRVHWVLDVRPAGDKWVDRNSWNERRESRYFRLRESWVKLIEDNGLQYRFLCPPQVAAGALKPYDPKTGEGFKVLVLPEILALSAEEAKAIRAFVAAGGTVIADKMPGTFDARGKRLGASPLAGMFDDASGRAVLLDKDMLPYYHQRLYPAGHKRSDDSLKQLVGGLLTAAVGDDRITPVVVGADGKPVTGVEVTVWKNGRGQLIAIHRNPQIRVNELGPQEYKKNTKFETPVKLTVKLPYAVAWFDVRGGKKLEPDFETTVTLQPFEPVILSAFHELPGLPEVSVEAGAIRIAPAQPCDFATQVYHLDFIGPDGKERLVYRMNVKVPREGGTVPLPVALNDQPGVWKVRVREVSTAATVEATFEVTPHAKS